MTLIRKLNIEGLKYDLVSNKESIYLIGNVNSPLKLGIF